MIGDLLYVLRDYMPSLEEDSDFEEWSNVCKHG